MTNGSKETQAYFRRGVLPKAQTIACAWRNGLCQLHAMPQAGQMASMFGNNFPVRERTCAPKILCKVKNLRNCQFCFRALPINIFLRFLLHLHPQNVQQRHERV